MIDQALSEIPIFQNLERTQLYELNTWLERKDVPSGETILKQDSPSDGLYVVAKGSVEVFVYGHGRALPLSTVAAPAVIGELGMLVNEPRTAEVRATTPVVLGFLLRELFEQKLAENNITALRIALTLGRIASMRLRSTTRKLVELTEHTAETVHV